MSEEFDFSKALDALRNGHNLTGKDAILTPLFKCGFIESPIDPMALLITIKDAANHNKLPCHKRTGYLVLTPKIVPTDDHY